MDDRQTIRLIILGLSGLLGLGAFAGYFWYHSQKSQKEEESNNQSNVAVLPPSAVRARKILMTPAPLPKSLSDKAANPDDKGKKLPPGQVPPITASKLPNQQTLPNGQPLPSNRTATGIPGAQPNKMANGQLPGTAKPVPGAIGNLAANQDGNGVVKNLLDKVRSKVSNVGSNDALVAANTASGVVGTSQASKLPPPPAIAGTTAAAVVPTVGNNAASNGTTGKKFPAITKDQAVTAAKASVGRGDPMQMLIGFLPFPRATAPDKGDSASGKDVVPPPPPSSTSSKEKTVPPPPPISDKLVPPPPPADAVGAGSNSGGGDLPIAQLPVPPSKPSIADKIKILALMDDRAIISFPDSIRFKNKWPKTITLGPGEQFESISVVSVNKDGITVQEDDERSTIALPAIR